jgi:hypothetical protein
MLYAWAYIASNGKIADDELKGVLKEEVVA